MKLISNALSLFIIAALAVMVFHGKPKQEAARDLSEDDLFCMVHNVYHESRGESVLGQAAVAYVTLNRVRSPAYPDSVCDVVWQKGQFSWTEDGRRGSRSNGAKNVDPLSGIVFTYTRAGHPSCLETLATRALLRRRVATVFHAARRGRRPWCCEACSMGKTYLP
jgi:hypothetical protein